MASRRLRSGSDMRGGTSHDRHDLALVRFCHPPTEIAAAARWRHLQFPGGTTDCRTARLPQYRDSMAQSRGSLVPRLVVLACLPLSSIWAILLLAGALRPVNQDGSAVIGFAAVLAYLFTFRPALFLVEPFAI